MKYNSARLFRLWYKEGHKHIINNPDYNQDYIGTYADGRKIKGFFEMYHGDKGKIEGFLAPILGIAEDGQAIYEFVQNAVDCESSHFYAFYNESYFLAINNGKPFNKEGLRSLLNVGQSSKESASQIGRLGIGFKLVHRLVGKGDGINELVKEYKGPILFSWSRLEDIKSLINQDIVEPAETIDENNILPYLLKICLTNFPADPEEEVRDLQYQKRILFSKEELVEMSEYVNQCLKDLPIDDIFTQGSLFFIKLGDGKKAMLKNDAESLEKGIQYSMNTLKSLKQIFINEHQIKESKIELEIKAIKIDSPAFREIAPEYTDYDIEIIVGYNKIDFNDDSSFEKVDDLKNSPNFYKFFPMEGEMHHLALFIHSNAFRIESNRRKLNEQGGNKILLREIAEFIKERLEEYKEFQFRDEYLQLYANILLSDVPRDNSRWLKPSFYDLVFKYIQTNVPVKGEGYCNDAKNVKIRKTNLDINLADIGLSQICWFEYEQDKIQSSARDPQKLNIKDWTILDIIENANKYLLNRWISQLPKTQYELLLKEINDQLSKVSKKPTEILQGISLFKFADGRFYSYNDVVIPNRPKWEEYKYEGKCVYTTISLRPLKNQFNEWGLVMSDLCLSDYPEIEKVFPQPSKEHLLSVLSNYSHKFYCSYLSKLDKESYECLSESLNLGFEIILPKYENLKSIENNKSLLGEDDHITEYRAVTNQISKQGIDLILDLCVKTEAPFFEDFFIYDTDKKGLYCIGTCTDYTKQFYAKPKEVDLIEKIYKKYQLLPKVFATDNVLKIPGLLLSKDLQDEVLSTPANYVEELVDFVDNAHLAKYFENIPPFRINLDKFGINKDCFEVKLFKRASDYYGKQGRVDIDVFRSKISVVILGKEYQMKDLGGAIDAIEYLGHKFNYSKLYPNEKRLNAISERFVNSFKRFEIDESFLNELLGQTDDFEADAVFDKLKNDYRTLTNHQQLYFVLLYIQQNVPNDWTFYVKNVNDRYISLSLDNLYSKKYSFVDSEFVLNKDYIDVNDDFPEDYILKAPYFHNGALQCPHLKKNLQKNEIIDLLDYLKSLWEEDSRQVKYSDWSNINELNSLSDIIGFELGKTIYPSKYALDNERLPEYIERWANEADGNLQFLADLGMPAESSFVIKLRKYLVNDINSILIADIKKVSDQQVKAAFDWFCQSGYTCCDKEQFEFVKKLSESVSSFDESKDYQLLYIYDQKKLDKSILLDDKGYKKWYKTTGYKIFLYPGNLPQIAFVNKYPNQAIFEFNQGDVSLDKNNKYIYVRKNCSLSEALLQLVNNPECELSYKEYSQLFENELENAKAEIKALKKELNMANKEIEELKARLRKYENND